MNTFGYVLGSPLKYNDPIGLAASTIQCNGKGDYEVVNINKGCDKACTDAHERSHIDDWKERYGSGSCNNKTKGYLPLDGPNYSTFLEYSECKAYRIGRECRQKLMGGGGCDCSANIKNDENQMRGLGIKCPF